MAERDIVGGLIRLHILHHASQKAIFGMGIMEELAHHGYKLSAGTLYPILHGMEKAGYLISAAEQSNGRQRRTYVATEEGKIALGEAKAKVWELFRELFEEELQSRGHVPTKPHANGKTEGGAQARPQTVKSQGKRQK
jgi:DNA-binding PadR family transcriptional regulator